MNLHLHVAEIRAKLTSLQNGSTYLDPNQKACLLDTQQILDTMDYAIDHPNGIIQPENFNVQRLLVELLGTYRFMVIGRRIELNLSGLDKPRQALGWADTSLLTEILHKILRAAFDSQQENGRVMVDLSDKTGPWKISVRAVGMTIDTASLSVPVESGLTVISFIGKMGPVVQISLGQGITPQE